MITGAIITFIVGTIVLFAEMLPIANTTPSQFSEAWIWAGGFIANFLWAVPNGTLFLVPIAGFIGVLISLGLWKFFNWITRNR